MEYDSILIFVELSLVVKPSEFFDDTAIFVTCVFIDKRSASVLSVLVKAEAVTSVTGALVVETAILTVLVETPVLPAVDLIPSSLKISVLETLSPLVDTGQSVVITVVYVVDIILPPKSKYVEQEVIVVTMVDTVYEVVMEPSTKEFVDLVNSVDLNDSVILDTSVDPGMITDLADSVVSTDSNEPVDLVKYVTNEDVDGLLIKLERSLYVKLNSKE